jgi:hypothetical protein
MKRNLWACQAAAAAGVRPKTAGAAHRFRRRPDNSWAVGSGRNGRIRTWGRSGGAAARAASRSGRTRYRRDDRLDLGGEGAHEILLRFQSRPLAVRRPWRHGRRQPEEGPSRSCWEKALERHLPLLPKEVLFGALPGREEIGDRRFREVGRERRHVLDRDVAPGPIKRRVLVLADGKSGGGEAQLRPVGKFAAPVAAVHDEELNLLPLGVRVLAADVRVGQICFIVLASSATSSTSFQSPPCRDLPDVCRGADVIGAAREQDASRERHRHHHDDGDVVRGTVSHSISLPIEIRIANAMANSIGDDQSWNSPSATTLAPKGADQDDADDPCQVRGERDRMAHMKRTHFQPSFNRVR